MKICAIICEFNPFHNGHAYLLRKAREISGCDAVVLVMSGQFTQRGEICRTDKFLRAKHAILNGADAVLELPAPFAVAPAEIFASGALKLISKIDGEIILAFGCESGNKDQFLKTAAALNDESEQFKSALAALIDGGESYIKAYAEAFETCGGDPALLKNPNNILGVEYTKAALRSGKNIEILPIERVGSSFKDETLKENFSSASAIRANADNPLIKDNMPKCSYDDFIKSTDNTERFENLACDSLFLADTENLKRIFGCTEGLENRLKKFADTGRFEDILEQSSNKRYSKARIRRIMCANLLRLYADDTRRFLNCNLPHKVLAVRAQAADKILPLFKNCEGDAAAKECYALSSSAYTLWRHLSAPLLIDNPDEKMILI